MKQIFYRRWMIVFLFFTCIASSSWAEIPLDIEGKQWGETLAFAKACKFEKVEIEKFDNEILYLLINRNNSTPDANDYTIKKYKEYSTQLIQNFNKLDCDKARKSFNFIHDLFRKARLKSAK